MAPDTVLDSVPSALSREKRVSITFHATSNANGFVCSLDGGTPTPCISAFEADVADGEHTFSVAAAMGMNIDDTPATHTWKVDATTPDTTLVMGPPALDNTVDPAITFTGMDPGGGAVTFQCKLDTGAFAPCNSPDTLNVTDGAHAFEVRAVDAAGNVDPTPAMHGWTVDTSTPDTTIVAGPAPVSTTLPDVTFTFSSPLSGVTFECSLDGAAFVPCTSPQVFNDLADGTHTFTVRAKSPAGTVDPSPATRTWTVDGTAPSVMITAQPTNPSNDSTPSFSFTSPDSTATYQCRIDAGTFAPCTSAFTSAALTDGMHTFRVRATDPVGNVGTEATYTWTIDTMAPTVTITSGPSGLIAVASASYAFTTAGSPTAIECQLDTGAFAACTSPRAYTTLADGAHTFTVRVTDAAGNTGMDMRMFTVDTTAPVVTITAAPTNPTADSTPTFMFTVTGMPMITQCSVDGGAFATCASPFTTGTLTDASHTVVVRATDAAGNTGSDMRTFTVDTTAPTVTIVNRPANPTNLTTANFTFTVSEGLPMCRLDGGAFAACTSPRSYTGLAQGSHTFTVQAADALGNTGSASYTWVIDTTPPTVTITSMPVNPSSSTTANFTFTVSEGSPQCRLDAGAFVACTSPRVYTGLADGSHTFTVQSTDAVGNIGSASYTWVIDATLPIVTLSNTPSNPTMATTASIGFTVSEGTPMCRLDAGAFVACTSPRVLSGLTDGSHTFTVQATDAVGNVGTASHTWVVDTVAPVVTLSNTPSNPTMATTANIGFTVSEGSPMCRLDAAAFAPCTSPRALSGLGNGSHTFTVQATDAVGNVGSASYTWVVDATAPTVTLTNTPSNPTMATTANFMFTVSEGSPMCRLDAAAFAPCTSPRALSGLTNGSHTFTVQATDAVGNVGSASYTWVVDNVPPTVTLSNLPSNPTAATTANIGFTVSEGSPQCRLDAAAFAPCTSPRALSGLAHGSHTFSVQTSDVAGNVGSASYTWFVDTMPPTVTILTAPTNPSNSTTATFTFSVSDGTIECQIDNGPFSTCATPKTYLGLGDGSHTFTVRSTDAVGRVGSATHTWVIDATGPVITFGAVPPAKWPVNYFRFAWSANETATYECSVNGAAFAPCTTPRMVTGATYNTNNTFAVRGRDSLNTLGATVTHTWAPADGLVLHYPWEQGLRQNTSWLRQLAAYSPSVAGQLAAVGGWAGTALRGPTQSTYVGTSSFDTSTTPVTTGPLTSSATGTYMGGMWIRATSDNANGVLWENTNASLQWGHRVTITSSTVTLRVFQNGTQFVVNTQVPLSQWVHVGVRTTGPAKGLELTINGQTVANAAPPSATGFDVGQGDLRVGPVSLVDIDDLRFYNRLVPCTVFVRGMVNVQGFCESLRAGLELDFEGMRLDNSGFLGLGVSNPLWTQFVDKLGEGFKLGSPQVPLSVNNFAQQVGSMSGHSIALWAVGASPPDVLFDFTRPCSFAANFGTCGIRVIWNDNRQFHIFTGVPGLTANEQKTTLVPAAPLGTAMNSLVLAEQRNANGTVSVRVYVNGRLETTIPIGNGDLYGIVSDTIQMPSRDGTAVDEIELWSRDISTDPEMLCENGFDGEWDHVADRCRLTSNP